MRNFMLAGIAALAVAAGPALADHQGQGRHGDGGRNAERHHDHHGYGMRSGGEPGERAERMFERLDADADGRVTRAEAFGGAARRFRSADGDGDYRLTPEEFAAMMRAEAERRAAEMFADLDRDGDGALDPWEAPRGPERMIGAMFDRLDADEDGVVTKEEAEAAGERMRERRRDRD